MDHRRLFLDELFLSLQGEASQLGRPQVFLRLAGCPLRCSYCDTPRSWRAGESYQMHLPGGLTETRANPLDAAALDAALAELCAAHGVSRDGLGLAVTGGEPLEQAEFLAAWLPSWPGPRMLETAGILPEALTRVLPAVDQVSLDWKLPATLNAGAELLAPAACLRAARAAGKELWVKLVVTAQTGDAELRAALEELVAAAPGATVYLQPATRFGKGPAGPDADALLRWSLAARDLPCDLRVVPQVHPLLGAR